jgi:hypothetical protein
MSSVLVAGRFPLSRAAEARRVALADARADYERAMVRVAAESAVRIRGAEARWRAARGNARAVAAARRETWKGYRAAATPDLAAALRRQEFYLTEWFRPHSVPEDLAVATWHVRVIRSEMTRRGVL